MENNHQFELINWSRTHTEPLPVGEFRCRAADFFVDEELGFEPSGTGEHLFLQVQKTNLNTQEVAGRLARHAGLTRRDVSYSGLKDKNAITQQWFSLHLRNLAEPDWSQLEQAQLKVLRCLRHDRKLRRGTHRKNRFQIVLRNFRTESSPLDLRIEAVRSNGFPNYYGEQRFGIGASNLANATRWFRGQGRPPNKLLRGLYLSSVRSWMFNQYLSQRVADKTWNSLLQGDWAMLDGSNSFFKVEACDRELERRVQTLDLHPTGTLFGSGAEPSQIEGAVFSQHREWCDALVERKVRSARRALRARVEGLEANIEDRSMELSFALSRGVYATSLLREIVDYQAASR